MQKIKFAKMFWAISIFFLGAGVLLCTLSFVLSESHYEMFWEGYARQLSQRAWAGIFSTVIGCILLVLWWQLRKQQAIEFAVHRSAEVQDVLREIAETAISAASVDELYRRVHRSIDRILPASLFHVSLLDEVTNEIVVIYPAGEVNFTPEHRPVGKEMAEQVMRLRRAVHAPHYLGVPLLDWQGNPFGAMGLILMDEELRIDHADIDLLSIIAAQVAMAIERKRALDKLRESEEKFRNMTDNASDVIWHLDRDFRFDYISPADERLTGYRIDEVIGTTIWSHLKPDGIEYVKRKNAERQAEEQTGAKTGTIRYELELGCKDGSWVWVEINVEPHHDIQGNLVGLHGVTRDITERKRQDQKLQLQATTDGLTGIFNRGYFWTRANEELQRIQRYGGVCSLLMVDVDHFKQVNDNYGHAVGDAVLRWITRLCRAAIHDTDLFGRIGGEEFAILLLELGAVEAVVVAERLRQSIYDSHFVTDEGMRIPLRVSVGVAQHKAVEESLTELMVRADHALYRAKREGRNKVVESD